MGLTVGHEDDSRLAEGWVVEARKESGTIYPAANDLDADEGAIEIYYADIAKLRSALDVLEAAARTRGAI